jgi:hypothetical protein
MNQPDSSEEKLMCKWTHGLNDSDTSSMELEQDSIRTSANHVRSNETALTTMTMTTSGSR